MSVDLAPRLVASERIMNGDMENWPSTVAAAGWTFYQNDGYITQDTTEQRIGLSCARISYLGSASVGLERYDVNIPPGQWCLVEAWAKATAARTNGLGLRLINLTKSREVNASSQWVTAATNYALIGSFNAAMVYQKFAFLFRAEDTAGISDLYAPVAYLLNTGGWSYGQSIYLDSISLSTPNARPIDRLGLAPLTHTAGLH